MFIQLKSHKAHIYSKNIIDPSKRTIVFIPGAGMDHRILSMFKLDAINNNFNIIAIDLPGHGYTTGPLFNDVESHTNCFVDLLNELNLNNLIFSGHSWGVLIALDLYTKYKNIYFISRSNTYWSYDRSYTNAFRFEEF